MFEACVYRRQGIILAIFPGQRLALPSNWQRKADEKLSLFSKSPLKVVCARADLRAPVSLEGGWDLWGRERARTCLLATSQLQRTRLALRRTRLDLHLIMACPNSSAQ